MGFLHEDVRYTKNGGFGWGKARRQIIYDLVENMVLYRSKWKDKACELVPAKLNMLC